MSSACPRLTCKAAGSLRRVPPSEPDSYGMLPDEMDRPSTFWERSPLCRVDPFEPNRVWFTIRTTGTHTVRALLLLLLLLLLPKTPPSVPTPRDCCYSCGWSPARHIATGAPLPCRIFQPNEFACPHPQGPFKFGRATYDATGATIQGPPECCSYTFNEASWGLNSKVNIRVRVCVHCCSKLPECCSCTYNEANLCGSAATHCVALHGALGRLLFANTGPALRPLPAVTQKGQVTSFTGGVSRSGLVIG